jgi:hypothetical protein
VINVADVAIITAITALNASFPLKWQADVREQGAESTFWFGGKSGACR